LMNLAAVYGKAEKEIMSEILSIDLRTFDAGRAEAMRRRIRRTVLGLDLSAKEWTESDLMGAYAAGERRTKAALQILGRKPRKPPMTTPLAVRDGALKVLVEANASIMATVNSVLEAALSGALVTRRAAVQEFDRQAILRRFEEMGAEAVAKELSRKELSSMIFERLKGEIGDDGLILIKGRRWNPRKYARMVARTEMRFAQTKATEELCRQYGNDLVEWSDHATDCAVCDQYEGKIYSLSGTDTQYPKLEVRPPAHPNCKHSILPTSKEAIAVRTTGTGLGGVLSTLATFTDAESVAVREAKEWSKVNGREVSYVLDDAGNLVLRVEGTAGEVTYTDAEMTRMLGAKMHIHTHPGVAGSGGTFSSADIHFYYATKPKYGVAIAVPEDAVYVVYPKNGVWAANAWEKIESCDKTIAEPLYFKRMNEYIPTGLQDRWGKTVDSLWDGLSSMERTYFESRHQLGAAFVSPSEYADLQRQVWRDSVHEAQKKAFEELDYVYYKVTGGH